MNKATIPCVKKSSCFSVLKSSSSKQRNAYDEEEAEFGGQGGTRVSASAAEASNQILIRNEIMEHDLSEEHNTYNVCDDEHNDAGLGRELGHMVDRISVSSSAAGDCCCSCTSSYVRPRPRPLQGNHRLHHDQATDSVTPTPTNRRRRDDDDPNSVDLSFSY